MTKEIIYDSWLPDTVESMYFFHHLIIIYYSFPVYNKCITIQVHNSRQRIQIIPSFNNIFQLTSD